MNAIEDGEYLPRHEAATRMGIHYVKLHRLRHAGHIPEARRIGGQYVYPASKLTEIRNRLIAAGLIKVN